MNHLFDQCFSQFLVQALRVINPEDAQSLVHIEADLGYGGWEDLDWIAALDKSQRWIVFTRDSRLRKKKAEREAWIKAGFVVVFFEGPWAHANTQEQAWRLIRWWPDLRATVSTAPASRGFQVPYQGQPKRLKPITYK